MQKQQMIFHYKLLIFKQLINYWFSILNYQVKSNSNLYRSIILIIINAFIINWH